tara:strand:- start:428 stop:2560 length:2133 start_codon:yes stop_codon:yes gene_type:complete
MINFIINGKALVSDKKTKFAISKAVAKLGELNSRHGDLSVSFSIPVTSENNITLGRIASLQNLSLNYTKKFEGYVEEKGRRLSTGYFQVTSIKKKRFKMRFFGGNSDWFSLIKEESIKDLDFSELSHEWKMQNIVSSFYNTTGYKYSIYDNGKNGFLKNSKVSQELFLQPDDFNLNVFIPDILKKVFNKNGLKAEGGLFNDPLFLSSTIPVLKDFLTEGLTPEEYRRKFGVLDTVMTYDSSPDPFFNQILFNQDDQDGSFDGSRWTFTADTETAEVNIDLLIEEGGNNLSFIFQYEVFHQSSISEPQTFEQAIPVGELITGTNVRRTSLELQQLPDDFQSGDYIQLNGISFSGATGESQRTLFQSVNGFKTSASFFLTGDSFFPVVSVSSLLPEIPIEKLIKDVMFQHGVISQYNANTRTITFTKLDEVSKNIYKAVDWTNKIDHSKMPEVDFLKLVSGYSKISRFEYLEDEEDLQVKAYNLVSPLPFGNGQIEIKNEFLSESSAVYESSFAGSASRWSFPYDLTNEENQNIIVTHIPLFKQKTVESGAMEFETVEPEPRMLLDAGVIPFAQISRSPVVVKYKDFNEDSYTRPLSAVGYCYFAKPFIEDTVSESLSLNRLNDTLAFDNPIEGFFTGNSLIQKNFSFLKKVLNKSFSFSPYVILSAREVSQIDFSIPRYLNLKRANGYFYIDEIYQYQGKEQPVLCHLVKI